MIRRKHTCAWGGKEMCWVCQDQEVKARKVRDKIMADQIRRPKKVQREMLICSGCSKEIDETLAATDPLGDPMHKDSDKQRFFALLETVMRVGATV